VTLGATLLVADSLTALAKAIESCEGQASGHPAATGAAEADRLGLGVPSFAPAATSGAL